MKRKRKINKRFLDEKSILSFKISKMVITIGIIIRIVTHPAKGRDSFEKKVDPKRVEIRFAIKNHCILCTVVSSNVRARVNPLPNINLI